MTGVGDAGGQVHWTEIDGVPVVWCEDRGPLRASLMFRVGKADEQLPTNGITHLVEHLALYRMGQQPHYLNGSVRTSITTFDSAGEVDEVTAFLAGVCQGLTDLPTDRREAEIRVLETEASRRSNGTYSAALSWRYGPAGPGLWAYDEFAGTTADDAALQAWSNQMFCRDNAVLLLTGPPPADLRLPLPSGTRQVPPYLVDVLAHNPAWFQHGFGDVAALSPLTRSAAAVAYTHVLQHRLVEQLRFELGVAYSPGVEYDAYDAHTALVFARADAHADHVQAVTDVLSESIENLADEGPALERVADYRRRSTARFNAVDGTIRLALSLASDFLVTGERPTTDDVLAELDALTIDAVQASAVEARSRMVYGVPETARLAPDRAWHVPAWSTEPRVMGRGIQPWEPQHGQLTLGSDGLTLDLGQARVATVRFATARGVLAWPDGRRVLVSPEGVSVTIEPGQWRDGDTVVAAIDRSTADRQVPMPARAEIPVTRRDDRWYFGLLITLVAVFGLCLSAVGLDSVVNPSPTAPSRTVGVLAVVTGVLLVGLAVVARRVRRRQQKSS